MVWVILFTARRVTKHDWIVEGSLRQATLNLGISAETLPSELPHGLAVCRIANPDSDGSTHHGQSGIAPLKGPRRLADSPSPANWEYKKAGVATIQESTRPSSYRLLHLIHDYLVPCLLVYPVFALFGHWNTMCNFIQREYGCGHHRYIASVWCKSYTTTHRRCPPQVTHYER